MNPVLSPEISEIIQAVHYRPAVSIILPFEPRMNLKANISHSLKLAAGKVEKELALGYPAETCRLVMQKIRNLVSNLNYNTNKKSIAIYVSPVFEKVMYLDIEVEEKILVDESFEIRDLVYSKKQLHKYLVMLLSAKSLRMYIGDTTGLTKILSETPDMSAAAHHDPPERVANFTDPGERKEILTDKFLQHADKSLGLILQAGNLPLFLLGTDRILGHFNKITRHANAIIDQVPGNYEEATIPELQKILAPRVQDWKAVKEKELLHRLEDAADNKKLASGIQQVWKEAMNLKGKLLVVEKNYMVPARHDGTPDGIALPDQPYPEFSNIRDAVDDIIEKILENGGDVEFTAEGLLKDYDQIALVLYY